MDHSKPFQVFQVLWHCLLEHFGCWTDTHWQSVITVPAKGGVEGRHQWGLLVKPDLMKPWLGIHLGEVPCSCHIGQHFFLGGDLGVLPFQGLVQVVWVDADPDVSVALLCHHHGVHPVCGLTYKGQYTFGRLFLQLHFHLWSFGKGNASGSIDDTASIIFQSERVPSWQHGITSPQPWMLLSNLCLGFLFKLGQLDLINPLDQAYSLTICSA